MLTQSLKKSLDLKPNLSFQQAVANTILIINISNSNNLNKFWAGSFTRRGLPMIGLGSDKNDFFIKKDCSISLTRGQVMQDVIFCEETRNSFCCWKTSN